jgi:hypothetical protein
MSMLGRRKHSRYLLAQPIEGNVLVRDEVTIETLSEREIVVLSPESCRPRDQVGLEIPGRARHRVNATVAESRPFVAEDGAIRHRLRLVPDNSQAETGAVTEEHR